MSGSRSEQQPLLKTEVEILHIKIRDSSCEQLARQNRIRGLCIFALLQVLRDKSTSLVACPTTRGPCIPRYAKLEERHDVYEEASIALTDIKLPQTVAFIEHNLKLLGATGFEDELQEDVPEAVESLRQAGIKVWILTGDKQGAVI
ncbi:HAD-like superfamily [Sesbania bispinosa]|nr:HAD-like superfamily [Sesbania bispinosa]